MTENKTHKMTPTLTKKAPAVQEHFTGKVRVNEIVTPEDDLNIVVSKVTFEQSARTSWHSYAHGQILVIMDGAGYYQERGKPVQAIRKGDVVTIPLSTVHWFGASHHSAMIHMAIVPADMAGTVWMRPVSDAEYDEGAC
jgi:quercetin dioxygenase-like cupin family protein